MPVGSTLGKAYIEIQADVDRFAESLRNGLKKLAGLAVLVVAFKKLSAAGAAARKTLLLTFASLAGGAFAAAGTAKILALAGSLLQLTGVAAALPAAIALGGAAMAGLLVATKGLGEAFGAAFEDAEQFEKAIEKLSPQAQKLAREFRSVVPELREIKNAAQDAFAGQLLGQIDETVRVLSGPLAEGLAKVSARFGEAAAKALEFARSQQNVGFLQQLFDQTAAALDGIGDGLPALLAGFQNAALAILPMFSNLGAGLSGIFAEIGNWLTTISQNGDLVRWLQQGMTVLGQLWSLISGIGQVLFSVLNAASASGASVLDLLARAVNELANFLQSAEGVELLNSLFGTLAEIASGLAPVITNLLSALGPVLGAIAPAVQAVVPALVAISEALGPALAAIAGPLGDALMAVVAAASTLAPYLVPLGEAIGVLLQAITPLIDALVWLAEPFQPIVEALKEMIAALIPIATALGPILALIFQTLADVATPLLEGLVQIFEALGPPIGELVAALGTALAPLLAALTPIVQVVVDVLLALLPAIVALLPAVTQIVVALTPLIDLLAQLLVWVVQLIGPILEFVAAAVSFLTAKAIVPLIMLIVKALVGLFQGLGKLPQLLSTVVTWLGRKFVDGMKALPGLIWRALQAIPQLLWKLFKGAFELALKAIGAGIGALLYAFFVLPGQIRDRVVSFLREFPEWWSRTLDDIRTNIREFIDDAVAFVASLPSRLMSAAAAIGSFLANLWSGIWENARNAFRSGVDNVVGFVTSIPGRFAALPGQLWNLGKSLIDSIKNGISAAGDVVGGLAGSIVNALKSFVNWVITKLNEGIAAIDRWTPGNLPRIPYLAEGDVVRKPTLAVVGEAGPEAVIPLTRPQRARDLLESSGLANLLRGDGVPQLMVRVFLGTREITDIVRVEIERALGIVAGNVVAGARA